MPQLLAMMEPFHEGEQIVWVRSRFEQSLGPTWGYDLEFGGRDAFLTELYVRPAVRRDGAALLEWIESAARAAGAGAIHSRVRPDNVAARALYARRGYASPPRELLSKPL
ncbi:MAG TPA: GNAT family N-acetyltransferase [Nannocystaceae bacterium]|nr:GNAT family N-acetyltransferase [Nannocystaceae bacterium]